MRKLLPLLSLIVALTIPAGSQIAQQDKTELPDAPQPAQDVKPHVIVVHVPISNPQAWQRVTDEAEAIKLLEQDAKDWRIVDLKRRKRIVKLFHHIETEW